MLWDGRLLFTGEVYEFGSDDLTRGIKYTKVIRAEDGKTDLQFFQLYPADISIMKEIAGYGALFAANGLGISMWNALDEIGLSWTFKMDDPKYVAAGADGQVLVVGKDSKNLLLFRAFDGQVLASLMLEDGVIGEPLPFEGAYVVPQKGKITILANNLQDGIVLKVDGLGGQVAIRPFDDGLLISDGQNIWKLTFMAGSEIGL